MLWVLLDVLIGLLALVVLGVTGWRLYRRIRVLTREVGAASDRVSAASPPPVAPRPTPHVDPADPDELFTDLPPLRPARRP